MTRKNMDEFQLMRPDEIKAYLDQYIIGQEEAKKTLSVAVYNHYKKVFYNLQHARSNTRLEKSNIILAGATGSGKTLMVRTIAKLLNVPCYIQDCTKITASGYVGSDVEDCLVGLLRACNYDYDAAKMGIVVLDEGDKIAKKAAGPSITRDVSGECVQQSLLKIVEGDIVGVPPQGGRKHPEQKLIYLDTTNILFILSGAFVGMEDIIRHRMGNTGVGFVAKANDMKQESYMKFMTPQDIRDFGLIPELVGRFPIIANVEKLSEDDLVSILSKPKNAIVKQYQELLAMDGVKLVFDPDALKTIAHLSSSLGNGARGLRTIVETVMTELMFEIPRLAKENGLSRLTITADMVRERTSEKYKNAQIA